MKERLEYVLEKLNQLDKHAIFSIHPRTRNAMKNFNINELDFPNISFIDPQSYFSNLGYLYYSSGLITDSGGMQKEAYCLQKKCVAIRKETEWTETLNKRMNVLLFNNLSDIQQFSNEQKVSFNKNLYGNSHTALDIVNSISINPIK